MCLFSHLFSQNNPTLSEVSAERHTRGSGPLRQLKVLCSGRRFATRRLENRPHWLRVMAFISLGCSEWLYSRKPGSTHSQGCFCVGYPDLWPLSMLCAQNPCGKLSKSCRTAVQPVTGDWFVIFFDICMKKVNGWSSLLCFRLTSCPDVQNLCSVVSIMPGLCAWTVFSVVYSTGFKHSSLKKPLFSSDADTWQVPNRGRAERPKEEDHPISPR